MARGPKFRKQIGTINKPYRFRGDHSVTSLGSVVESRLYSCTVIASDNAIQSKDFKVRNQ